MEDVGAPTDDGWGLVAAALVAAMIVPFGVASAGKSDGPQGEPIKIGVIAQISGPAGGGELSEDIYQTFQDQWNASLTSKDRPIQLIVEDSALDAQLARTASNKLLNEDNVVAVINGSLIGCPVNGKTDQAAGVAAIGGQVTESCYIPGTHFPLTRIGGSNGLTAALDWAESEGKKTFGFIYPAGPAVKPVADALEAYGKTKKDIDVVITSVPLPPTAADWDLAINTLKEAGADVSMILAQPEWTVVALEEAAVQGFGPEDGITWISGPNVYDPDNLTAIPNWEGTYVMLTSYPFDYPDKGVQKVVKSLGGKKNVDELGPLAGLVDPLFYTRKLIEKAEKSGEVTRESVLAAAKSIKKFKGTMVPTTVFPNDPSKDPIGAFILKIEDGGFVHASDDFIISGE